MAALTSGAAVRLALRQRTEVGLLDVRPEGPFAEGHPLFAASFPLGRLEGEVFDRLPRRSVPLVVYGDAAGDAAATAGTPAVTAGQLRALLRSGADMVVLDARRFEEYQTMSIPTATSVPGAELVMGAGVLAPDPGTLVVVNCAGRTRSIIGTQSLINAGLPNRVVALRNGTIGWSLAGLDLEHGQQRRAPEVPLAVARRAEAAAWAVAGQAGAARIGAAALASLLDRGTRTVYRFDVRSPEDYLAGHLAGFRSAPGGQLVQETDRFAPVRGALVVLAGDGAGRAAMTASWLAQMGWEVAVLRADGPGAGGPGPARRGSRSRRGRGRRPGRGRRSRRKQIRPRSKAGCAAAGQRSSTSIPAACSKPGTCRARPGRCGPTSATLGWPTASAARTGWS